MSILNGFLRYYAEHPATKEYVVTQDFLGALLTCLNDYLRGHLPGLASDRRLINKLDELAFLLLSLK